MMTEISLNVLDIVQNSIRANADLIQICVTISSEQDTLTITITDNGSGMSEEQLIKVLDPFYTTRTTRSIGLGIPFFKQAAESTGGEFKVTSDLGVGTLVRAVFKLSHIDRMPLGDMTSTIHALITLNTNIDFLYIYTVDEKNFTLDTREFREILGDVSFSDFEVSSYIREYLRENKEEVDNGMYF
jgi:anti-sigma regulatory factor (Ser/Thr protein kinase)